jgi:hypothetical protein
MRLLRFLVYILDEVEDAMILGLSFINHQQKRKGKKHERILAIMSSMASSTPPNSRLRGRDQRGKCHTLKFPISGCE